MLKNRFLKYIIFFGLMAFGFVYGRNENKLKISFGIIADVQYCECVPQGTRFYSNSLKKLAECTRDFNARELRYTPII